MRSGSATLEFPPDHNFSVPAQSGVPNTFTITVNVVCINHFSFDINLMAFVVDRHLDLLRASRSLSAGNGVRHKL